MVLKKRKVVNGNEGVGMKIINNTGANAPFLPSEIKNSSSSNKINSANSVKNNNMTMNNAKVTSERTKNTSVNMDAKNGDCSKSDQIDLEAGYNNGCSDCAPRNWVEIYLTILSLKWFTVSC